jgi:hypothetical protein
MADGRRIVSAAGGIPVPSSSDPVSNPPERQAGHDRCSGGSKPPHVGETWRNRRTGVEDVVVLRADDYLYMAGSGFAWPIDLFVQRWEPV